MALVLENISRSVAGQSYLKDINLSFETGSFNVLLGRTLAGKTSLLRLIAGLDKPSAGRMLLDQQDISSWSVQRRNMSMVYQQFINYPHLSVWDNIASPLKINKTSSAEIKKRVQEVAEMLHIEAFLQRLPLELSGGQQQRCAMARALVKDASVVLFDEPLVNLDYKLREELRSELRSLFKQRNSIAIYATTEAHEALALGGNTTLLHQGQVLQSGPAAAQYARLNSLNAADLYNEPPLNRLSVEVSETTFSAQSALADLSPGHYMLGIRPDHVSLSSTGQDEWVLDANVELAEISASETYLHVALALQSDEELNSWVVHIAGIQQFHTQTPVKLFIPLDKVYVFDRSGNTLRWPQLVKRGSVANG